MQPVRGYTRGSDIRWAVLDSQPEGGNGSVDMAAPDICQITTKNELDMGEPSADLGVPSQPNAQAQAHAGSWWFSGIGNAPTNFSRRAIETCLVRLKTPIISHVFGFLHHGCHLVAGRLTLKTSDLVVCRQSSRSRPPLTTKVVSVTLSGIEHRTCCCGTLFQYQTSLSRHPTRLCRVPNKESSLHRKGGQEVQFPVVQPEASTCRCTTYIGLTSHFDLPTDHGSLYFSERYFKDSLSHSNLSLST